MAITNSKFWKQWIRSVFAYCVGLIVILLLTPLLIILIIPFAVYRRVLFYSAKWFRPDLSKMLHARATLSAFENVYKSPRLKLVVSLVLEGVPTREELNNGMKSTLDTTDPRTGGILYPELSQCLATWMGYRFWKPIKNFDLKDYVEYIDNQDNPLSSKDAENFIKDETLVPFEKDKSLWKLTLFTNYRPNESHEYFKSDSQYSYLVLCVHHCLVDGFSMTKLIHRIVQARYVEPKSIKKSNPPLNLRILKTVKAFVRVPCDLGKEILYQKTPSKMWEPDNVEDSEKNLNCTDNQLILKTSLSELIPFNRIKEIRQIHDVTSIAVIIAAYAGSIRKNMFKNLGEIPRRVKFTFPVPLPNHPVKLRNHVNGITLTLPVGEADPLKRLLSINETILKVKESTVPLITGQLGLVFGALPPVVLEMFVKSLEKTEIAFMSSFPSPREEIQAFGKYAAKDIMWVCSCMKGTKVLASSFTTYAGNGRLIVGADPSVLPTDQHAANIVSGFVDELFILKNLVGKLESV